MIVEVSLSNVKSYSNQSLKFTKGVNAIIGENGAGKTTILEAIGFALFDSLPYKISDFLRRGEKKGEVRVKLVSPKDERVYEIVRKFSENGTTEYYIHDPESVRVAEGIVEVTSWIKEQFDVEVSLKTIFENAIGVSQGKVVSQFLETASVRDKIFSPILGIEGYKKAFEKSREYEKYLEEKINSIDKNLAVKRKEIERKQKLESKIKKFETKENELSNLLINLNLKIEPVKKKIDEFDKILNELKDLQAEKSEINAKLAGVEEQLRNAIEEFEKIKKVEKEASVLRESYERYIKAEKAFNALNNELIKIESRIEEIKESKIYLAKLSAEIKSLEDRIKKIEESEKELEKIVLLAKKEEEIQDKLRKIENNEKVLIELENQIEALKEEIKKKEEILRALYLKVEKVKKLKEKLERIPEDVESRRDRLIEIISKLKAELKIEKAEYENVKENVCPILKEDCDRLLNVKFELEKRIKSKIAKLNEYKKKLEKIDSILDAKRKIEKTLNELKVELKQIKELRSEVESKKALLSELDKRKKEVETEVSKKDVLISKLKEVEGSVNKKIALESEIKDKDFVFQTLNEKKKEIESVKKRLKDKEVVEKKYSDLKLKLKKLEDVKNLNKKNYERFLQVKEVLKRREEVFKNVERLKNLKIKLIKDKNEVDRRLNVLKKKYDEELHLRLKEDYQKLISKRGEIEGELKTIKSNIQELYNELKELVEVEEEISKLESEMEKFEKKYKFVKDLRDIFKKAIPEITKAYVNAISIEANRIFCETMNDYNWEIRWSEDFGVKAKYRGRDIDFMQMSGGEQMCAALAIRLALLKVLSNVGIAFFDEPTQNMDGDRRRNLAIQLSKIEGFRQIFVISHDDTFEEMVENAIKIKKENGVSVVESV